MNTETIRKDFPILNQKINKKPVIYFDSACVSLKPQQVIDAINRYYTEYSGCAGRSAHSFARKTTAMVDTSRKVVADFINAKKTEEIVFLRNATEGINLVANGLNLKKGDVVVTSDKEHNSNFVPFLNLKKKGVVHETYECGNIDDLQKKLSKKVKLVSVVHTSNLDGTTQDIKTIAKHAHQNNSLILVDAAQSVPHHEINVQSLDVDFFAFSGHKMCGPSGTGALFGKKDLLKNLEYYNLGGSTVQDSTYSNFKIDNVPMRFEAGLQDYAGIAGFAEAANYLKKIGMKNIEKHEKELNTHATKKLEQLPVSIISKDQDRGGIISFNVDKMHQHDVASLLDASANIMVRSGTHCVHSWFHAHKLDGSIRASFYLYNTKEEIDIFVEELSKISKMGK